MDQRATQVNKDEVEALSKIADLKPETLAWMWAPKEEATSPPPPPPRHQYVPLTDAEWSAISPHWPTANQARTSPRNIVNSLLMMASTGCSWNDVEAYATVEAARQQFRRRAKAGVLKALPEALRGHVDDKRLAQFEKLETMGDRV